MGPIPVELEDAKMVEGELVIVRKFSDEQGREWWFAQPYVGRVMWHEGRPRVGDAGTRVVTSRNAVQRAE